MRSQTSFHPDQPETQKTALPVLLFKSSRLFFKFCDDIKGC